MRIGSKKTSFERNVLGSYDSCCEAGHRKDANFMSKVLFVLVDALRPDAIEASGEDYFQSLMAKGTYCMNARSVIPTQTLPCHVSIFYGVSSERHGITQNDGQIFTREPEGLLETIHRHKKTTAAFHDWEQLRDICKPGSLDYSRYHRMVKPLDNIIAGEREMLDDAVRHINRYAPDFVFFYFGSTDVIGHQEGWMSPEYLAAVDHTQRCTRELVESVPDCYTLVFSSDHGGAEKTHQYNLPTDLAIPMIFCGEDFSPGVELQGVSLLDLAPTICDLLGLPINVEWEGKSILWRG